MGEVVVYGNLGNACVANDLSGAFSKAIKYLTQHLSIATEVVNRAGEGRVYGSLGCVYASKGDFSKAIEHHSQHLTMAKEVVDLAGKDMAY